MLKRINIVTTNEGKAREFTELGKTFNVDVNIVRLPKIEIQSNTLESVALTSAVIASLQLSMDVVVEDAGLFIRALNWFPGVYSSFVYKTIGVKGILKLMKGIKDRYAYFKSVIAFADIRRGIIKLFTGVTEGSISYEARGSQGFGFDPIFIPRGSGKTYAEMTVNEKNAWSHRSKAFKELVRWLTTTF